MTLKKTVKSIVGMYFIADAMPIFIKGKGFEAYEKWIAQHVIYLEEAKR